MLYWSLLLDLRSDDLLLKRGVHYLTLSVFQFVATKALLTYTDFFIKYYTFTGEIYSRQALYVLACLVAVGFLVPFTFRFLPNLCSCLLQPCILWLFRIWRWLSVLRIRHIKKTSLIFCSQDAIYYNYDITWNFKRWIVIHFWTYFKTPKVTVGFC